MSKFNMTENDKIIILSFRSPRMVWTLKLTRSGRGNRSVNCWETTPVTAGPSWWATARTPLRESITVPALCLNPQQTVQEL
ncbi:hypothetical protein Hamer_G016740 [Homarus americanus]|uniref:Uncharacterized protein n=1 Tax=Homarus americanus TaxID=6706 RepID=A0A8J5NE80_HOMAM|nr:hypothetical protein Hamer_G016740 [Homarus americanus]